MPRVEFGRCKTGRDRHLLERGARVKVPAIDIPDGQDGLVVAPVVVLIILVGHSYHGAYNIVTICQSNLKSLLVKSDILKRSVLE